MGRRRDYSAGPDPSQPRARSGNAFTKSTPQSRLCLPAYSWWSVPPVNTTPCFVTMSCPKNRVLLNPFVSVLSKHEPLLDHGRSLSLFLRLLWLLCAPFEFSLA